MHVAIIKKLNKSNGTTYVYESVSYWDKEKQQPRSKRKLIGKLDPDTGEIVPTGPRGRKPSVPSASEPFAAEPAAPVDPVSDPLPEDTDYRALYEQTRRLLLEKEAWIASMESSVSKLTSDKQQLISELEQLLNKYKR